MSLSDDDDDMVAEYSPDCYLLNSRELNLLEEAVEENHHAGSLIVVCQRAQICRNVHVTIRTVCSSTSILENCTRVQVQTK